MAQIKRKKVSNVATKNKFSFKALTKKWWFWCLSVVVVAGIALAIILPITLSGSSDDKKPDYFKTAQTYELNGQTYEVNFEKMSYSGVLQHIDSTKAPMYDDFVFVFATDLSSFYPKDYYLASDTDKENNLKNEIHEKMFNLLINLQYKIDEYNKNHNAKCKLYIVDTTTNSYSENASILDDSTNFKTNGNDYPLFAFYKDDELVQKFSATINEQFREDWELYFYEAANTSKFQTIINNAIKYIENEFVDEQEA